MWGLHVLHVWGSASDMCEVQGCKMYVRCDVTFVRIGWWRGGKRF